MSKIQSSLESLAHSHINQWTQAYAPHVLSSVAENNQTSFTLEHSTASLPKNFLAPTSVHSNLSFSPQQVTIGLGVIVLAAAVLFASPEISGALALMRVTGMAAGSLSILTLLGCEDKDPKDSRDSDNIAHAEPPRTPDKPIDEDGDGYSPPEDCCDAPSGCNNNGIPGYQIYPSAPETAYDGVDSNCNGDDVL